MIIAQGGESGGYCGEVSTMTLVPQVVDAVSPIPVVAAGGIFDGRGIAAALMLGAAGVNMGTRFIACMEAPAPAEWKRAITQAKSEDARSRSTSSTTSVRCRGRSVSAPFRAPCARPSWMSGAASARRRVASAIVCAIRSFRRPRRAAPMNVCYGLARPPAASAKFSRRARSCAASWPRPKLRCREFRGLKPRCRAEELRDVRTQV